MYTFLQVVKKYETVHRSFTCNKSITMYYNINNISGYTGCNSTYMTSH